MGWNRGWRRYVPRSARRANGNRVVKQLAKKEGRESDPVVLQGKVIASSFWGKSWCENLESYSDFSNRLPRGRTYVRNGSVIDLRISPGEIKSLVCGSDVYEITINIDKLPNQMWKQICSDCSQEIESLLELLQGKFSRSVMQRLTKSGAGMFPQPREIKMKCSCPDWATMCKHVAATLYGVGARLDRSPELLFVLRAVDHLELIQEAVASNNLDLALDDRSNSSLGDADLGSIFNIELETTIDSQPLPKTGCPKKRATRSAGAKADVAGPTVAPAGSDSAPKRAAKVSRKVPRKKAKLTVRSAKKNAGKASVVEKNMPASAARVAKAPRQRPK